MIDILIEMGVILVNVVKAIRVRVVKIICVYISSGISSYYK